MSDDFCTVTETEKGFEYWRSRSYTNDSTAAIANANALLVPWEEFRGYENPVFPAGTQELFVSVKEAAPPGVRIDIAANDDDYQEVALHQDEFYLPAFVAQSVLAPVVAGLLVEYIWNKWGRKREEPTVKANVIVDFSDQNENRVVQISFDGPAKHFRPAITKAVEAAKSLSKRKAKP